MRLHGYAVSSRLHLSPEGKITESTIGWSPPPNPSFPAALIELDYPGPASPIGPLDLSRPQQVEIELLLAGSMPDANQAWVEVIADGKPVYRAPLKDYQEKVQSVRDMPSARSEEFLTIDDAPATLDARERIARSEFLEVEIVGPSDRNLGQTSFHIHRTTGQLEEMARSALKFVFDAAQSPNEKCLRDDVVVTS